MSAEARAAGGERAYPRLHPLLYDSTRGVMRLLFRLLTRVHVTFLAPCPAAGPVIFVVNHLSFVDGPLVFAMLPVRVRPLVAARFRRHPFAPLCFAAGAIFIERGRPDRAALRAVRAALADGGCLAVAIEGKRSPDGRLQEGKNGVAYLVGKTGAPLVPAAIWGTERVAASLRRLRRPEIHLCLGPVLPSVSPELDVSRLDESTRAIMGAIAALLPAEYRGDLQEPGATS